MSGPPTLIAPHVLTFCEGISSGSRPSRLAIRPEAGCRPRECFYNVRHKVTTEGGRIRFGWSLLEWPRVFIEAGHHAVYENPDGELLDITPSCAEDPQVARVFLPDDAAMYDFDGLQSPRSNIQQALADDDKITEYLRLGAELAEIQRRTHNSNQARLSDSDAARSSLIGGRARDLKLEIALRYTPQGALCFCTSGKKFKRCHGTTGPAPGIRAPG